MGERLYLHDHEVLFLFFEIFKCDCIIFYNGKKMWFWAGDSVERQKLVKHKTPKTYSCISKRTY